MEFKDQIGLKFWEEEEPYGRRGRGRREEEEGGIKPKVWMLDFGMNFVWKLGILA